MILILKILAATSAVISIFMFTRLVGKLDSIINSLKAHRHASVDLTLCKQDYSVVITCVSQTYRFKGFLFIRDTPIIKFVCSTHRGLLGENDPLLGVTLEANNKTVTLLDPELSVAGETISNTWGTVVTMELAVDKSLLKTLLPD